MLSENLLVPVPLCQLSQQPKLAIAPVVTAIKLVQDGFRKPGLHKPGLLQQLPPQITALVPPGLPTQVMVLVPRTPLQVQVTALVPHGLPTQVMVLAPLTPPQVTALVAQAGAIKTTTAVFNVCYNLKLLG